MSRIANSGYLDTKIYNEIKDLIINGELKPGELIIQDQIAHRFGVSRTPVRRALIELERDYLLESTPQGIKVREFSASFLLSVWEVRTALEGLSCRLAARVLDKAMLAYLRAMFTNAYEEWKLTGDDEAYRKADIVFHTKLVEAGQNPILKSHFNKTHVLTIAFSKGLIRTIDETYPEHMEILDALEQRDEDQAERLMHEHLRKTLPNISSLML